MSLFLTAFLRIWLCSGIAGYSRGEKSTKFRRLQSSGLFVVVVFQHKQYYIVCLERRLK